MSKDIYIVNFSGGKDSTAMLLRLLEEGHPVDEIVFLDTGAEFPQMYRHIDKVEKYIDRGITRLRNPKGDFFFFATEYTRTKGKHKHLKGLGFPSGRVRWCTAYLKRDVYKSYIRKKYKGFRVFSYIAIAYDEPRRVREKNGIIYPLVEWKMTQKDDLEYCYKRGFDWEGLYEHFTRVSCFVCPYQRLHNIHAIFEYHPELWQRIKDLESRTFNNFYNEEGTVGLERRFLEINKAGREETE